LTDIIARLCPRKVLVIDPLSGDGSVLDEVKARNSMSFPNYVYSENGIAGKLELIYGMENQLTLDHLLSWLE